MADGDQLHPLTARALRGASSGGSRALDALRSELVRLSGTELRVVTNELILTSRALTARGAHDAATLIVDLARAALGPLKRAVAQKNDVAATRAATYRRFAGERRPVVAETSRPGIRLFDLRCSTLRSAR